jgi:hypothetical protein
MVELDLPVSWVLKQNKVQYSKSCQHTDLACSDIKYDYEHKQECQLDKYG